jgi:hypothetical protein
MRSITARIVWCVVAACMVAGLSVYAQSARPYRPGSVWEMSFIRMKPGMDTAYLNYIATDWKRIQESAKKEGLILSYRVLSTEAHDPTDWNLILMTEYKDLATFEANEQKADAFFQKTVGDDQQQMALERPQRACYACPPRRADDPQEHGCGQARRGDDMRADGVDVAQDIVVPEAEDCPAVLFQRP